MVSLDWHSMVASKGISQLIEGIANPNIIQPPKWWESCEVMTLFFVLWDSELVVFPWLDEIFVPGWTSATIPFHWAAGWISCDWRRCHERPPPPGPPRGHLLPFHRIFWEMIPQLLRGTFEININQYKSYTRLGWNWKTRWVLCNKCEDSSWTESPSPAVARQHSRPLSVCRTCHGAAPPESLRGSYPAMSMLTHGCFEKTTCLFNSTTA